MKTPRKNIFVDRLHSVKYAVRGLVHLVQNENAIKVHLCNTLIITLVGFFFKINATEWMFQFLTLGFVISVEALNSAIEEIADYIQPNFDEKIGKIKDIGAGAVLFSSLFGIIVICFIYIPKILQYYS